MRLSDCEISHRHVRGQNLVVIFGERAVSADELIALQQEYVDAYGPDAFKPAYASPAGWQLDGSLTPEQMEPGQLASRFVFDEGAEVVLVDGVKIAGGVLDALTKSTPEGCWVRVNRTDDKVVVEQRHVDELQRAPVAPAPTEANVSPAVAPSGAPGATPAPAAPKSGRGAAKAGA